MDPIPCAYETDAVTYAKVMVREDNVMTIKFKDGSFYVLHADGTQMNTTSDQSQIRIEKNGYAPMVLKNYEPGRDRQLDETTDKKYLKVEDRSVDGVVKESHLPDGTIVKTYREV